MIIDQTWNYDINDNEINLEQQAEIKSYYYLYEYTDKIQLITDNPLYPSMLNYVKTCLLTEEEMKLALL